MKGTAKELQEISLIGLMSDPYLLSKCYPQITDRFFENPFYKLIYNSLVSYYKKYLTIPSKKELVVVVKEFYKEEYGDIDKILETINSLYETSISSEDYVYDKITQFIRRNRIESSLDKVVSYINKGDIDLDVVATEFRDSLTLSVGRSEVLELSDVSRLKEIKEEALGPSENPILVKFFIDPVNWCMQYKAIPPGTLNMIVAPPGRGKTTTLINQGVYTAKQGFNSLHVFLGDMSKFDGLLRYVSCYTGIHTSKLIDLPLDELGKLITKYNMSGILGHITIASYGAEEYSPNQLIEEIRSIQKIKKKHYDVIIIDYDENFAKDTDSMYESGGNTYNRLALFAVLNNSVVFIAAQPKPEYWSKEIIPLEAAAESSKKQKIIDLMLTIGSPSKNSSVGTLNIAKNRRGEDCKLVRIKKDGQNARVEAVSEEEYIKLKNDEQFDKDSKSRLQ